ncbi:MAG: 4Fe-4S binding protein, partial [Firmicutes bacterium]|nr:4Fe-4S binding protein [Bacillota bacterium]
MKIAVLSGKGGTGKTFIAANLAAAASQSTYFDCDVEEPNGHLFFRPENVQSEPVQIIVPEVDQNKCDGCKWCVDFCKFKALAYVPGHLMVFEEMCHSCGGCILFCPQKALTEKLRPIGRIEKGFSDNTLVYSGFLNPGEESGVPIIEELLRKPIHGETVLIDSPPGSSCSVMESIIQADYCLLVAESTSFGVHNLEVARKLVQVFNKPYGVIVNKSFPGDHLIGDYCRQQGIKFIGSIPFDQKLAQELSRGRLVARENKHFRRIFQEYLTIIAQEVSLSETAARS